MKKVVLLLVLLLTLVASSFGVTYASVSGGYTAEFVGTPTVQPMSGKTDTGEVYTGEDAYFENSTVFESISYADFQSDITEDQLINALKLVIQDQQATVVNGGKTTVNDHLWYLLVLNKDGHAIYLGATFSGKRLYLLTVVDDAGQENAATLLRSIKFTATTEN